MKTLEEKRQRIFSVLIIFFLFSQLSGQTELPKSKHYNLEKLADGVYAAIHNDNGGYAICNAGIIDIGNKTIVIDPFISPEAARDLKRHAEELTGKAVSLVINTHDHSDHIRGNQVFVPDADIIGTAAARETILKYFQLGVENDKIHAPEGLESFARKLEDASEDEKAELVYRYGYYKAIVESLPELKMVPPNITIIDTTVIYGTKRKIILIPTGIGHSWGDMITYLPEDSILFMGDLLFNERHPYIGGDYESWNSTLKKVVLLKPKIVIPGHGAVGDVNSVYALSDYFETLKELVVHEIEKGTDEKEITELPIPEKYESWWYKGKYPGSLQTIYKKEIDKNKNK